MERDFAKKVQKRPGGENLFLCFSCGSCTATCPISEIHEDFNPRLTIKKVQLGMQDEVLKDATIWQCIQCHRCVAHCPQDVKYADIVRVLRELAVEEGHYPVELLDDIDEVDLALRKLRRGAVEKHLEEGTGLKDFIASLNGGEGDG